MDIGDIKYLVAPAKVITKLSDAIRIGSKIRPQATIANRMDRSCALQAAEEAITGSYSGPFSVYAWAERTFSISHYMSGTISAMNDLDCCTREQIADWVEAQGY